MSMGIEKMGKAFGFKLPGLLSNKKEETEKMLEVRAEAAAYSASKFFGLPEARIQKGDTIGVYKLNEASLTDDVFQYSIKQFKELGCTSFEDMTKIWSHECGHRLLQNILPSSWANELGSDFFAGVRSEMLGLPKSNFEKTLGATSASKSHPGGPLRIQAMDYGRKVVAQMRKAGIQPTWENCIDAYVKSPFAKMTYENSNGRNKLAGEYTRATTQRLDGFIDRREFHLREAENAKEKEKYYLREAEKATDRKDYSKAADYARSAESERRRADEEIRAANRCTK